MTSIPRIRIHGKPLTKSDSEQDNSALFQIDQSIEIDSPISSSCPELHYDSDGYVTAACQKSLMNFHPEIVLFEPQIPQNTGSIARLCAAMSAKLHLVEPMAFQICDKKLRRAGLDYWQYLDLVIHQDWATFVAAKTERRFVFVETGGTQEPASFAFAPGDCLIFGAETHGIPNHVLKEAMNRPNTSVVTIPMFQRGVRSINLANTVSIVLYTAISQLHHARNPFSQGLTHDR